MQKFHYGDHVKIAKDLKTPAPHLDQDREAIVLYSYEEECGNYGNGDQKHEYHIYIKGVGEVHWCKEHQLTLIKKKDLALLSKWKKEIDRKETRE